MINIIIPFLFTLLISLNSLSQSVADSSYSVMLDKLLSHSVPEVAVHEAKSLQNVVYLDAREMNEYQVSHIQNAVWVGYDQFQKDPLKSISKDSKIIVYCSVGYRSEKISEKLIKMGYKDVSNLYGGLFEWSNQEMPLVNDSSYTNAIHAYDQEWGQWVTKGKKVY